MMIKQHLEHYLKFNHWLSTASSEKICLYDKLIQQAKSTYEAKKTHDLNTAISTLELRLSVLELDSEDAKVAHYFEKIKKLNLKQYNEKNSFEKFNEIDFHPFMASLIKSNKILNNIKIRKTCNKTLKCLGQENNISLAIKALLFMLTDFSTEKQIKIQLNDHSIDIISHAQHPKKPYFSFVNSITENKGSKSHFYADLLKAIRTTLSMSNITLDAEHNDTDKLKLCLYL